MTQDILIAQEMTRSGWSLELNSTHSWNHSDLKNQAGDKKPSTFTATPKTRQTEF